MKKKILSLGLVLLMTMSFLSTGVSAQSVDDLKNDLESIEQKQAETQKKIDTTKATISEVMEEVQRLDGEITKIEGIISNLQRDVDATEAKLVKIREELKKAEEERKEYKEVLDERLRVMYMFGESSYLEILFSADDFGDLISKIDMIRTVIEYDQEIFAKLEAVEKEIESKKEEIEVEKNNIIAKQNEARRQRSSLSQVRVSREGYVKELTSNARLLEQEQKALEAESNKIKNEIMARQSINEKVNSRYLWPTPGYARITSPYGNRIHPILGYQRFHSGIDISVGGRRGVNTIAVGFGEVIGSTYSGGYGNVVTIDLGLDDNGNRVSAVYAHLARRYVSVGDKVSPGTPIGEVGTTGMSTGIHLHFEIRINGNTVNPLSYVSP